MMNDSIRVRRASIVDRDTIVAFNGALALETEGLGLEESILRDGVHWALSHPETGPYFLAECRHRVVGQCMVTYEWSDWRNGWLWWFQSVYVPPDHRRRGVFRALFHHVETLAKKGKDVRGLRLYVEQNNQKAMEVYAKLGMHYSGYLVYACDV